MGDPGAEFSFRRFRILKKKQKTPIGAEGLLKLPQLWKKAKRCAAFSHSCLDKPSQQTCSAYPQFQQARRRLNQ